MNRRLKTALGTGLLVGLLALGGASATAAVLDGPGGTGDIGPQYRYQYTWELASGQAVDPAGDQDQIRLQQRERDRLQDALASGGSPDQTRTQTQARDGDCSADCDQTQQQTRDQTQARDGTGSPAGGQTQTRTRAGR